VTAMSVAVMSIGLGAVVDAPQVAAIDYRLPAPGTIQDRCRRTAGDEILVCGRRDNARYRLRDVALPPGTVLTRPSPFAWDLGGGAVADIDLDQVQRPDGYVDHRIMLRVRVPF
jgi:hypothetical protein